MTGTVVGGEEGTVDEDEESSLVEVVEPTVVVVSTTDVVVVGTVDVDVVSIVNSSPLSLFRNSNKATISRATPVTTPPIIQFLLVNCPPSLRHCTAPSRKSSRKLLVDDHCNGGYIAPSSHHSRWCLGAGSL